jgi:hypothetical protein
MSDFESAILARLEEVQTQRAARQQDPALGQRVLQLKAYQHRRFEHTHAVLLEQPRYAAATRFFLDDLYGPQDFALRDAQFARVVPALVRLFPEKIVATVHDLASLHALSEDLDSAMGRVLPPGPVTASAYVEAWHQTGRPADREQQLALVLRLGGQLDQFTRSRLLRNSLRLMRKPAQAAGLAALQQFLERGFDTFAAMAGADDFLAQIARPELALIAQLFSDAPGAVTKAIGQLP